METLNDIMYNLVKYPVILGELILEEGHQLNQQIHKQIKDNITDNITKLNISYLEFYEYIPVISISTIITLWLVLLAGFIILYKSVKTKANTNTTNTTNTNKSTSIVSSTVKLSSIGANLKPALKPSLKLKPIIINKGLYLESVKELNTASEHIVKKFEKGQTYWVLIRAQMRDYINMAGTKYELRGNNIHVKTANTKEAFHTKDVYLILNFKIIADINKESLVGYQIIHFMNELNHIAYSTNDFIICAICTSPNIGKREFYNGLKNIDYELENHRQVDKQIQGTNISVNYNLLLPIHQVYDLFMDVYNNCVFESTKYVIDNENYESWNGKSINELVF